MTIEPDPQFTESEADLGPDEPRVPLWPPVVDGSAEQAEGYRQLVSWVLWVDERLARQGKPSLRQQAAERRQREEAGANPE